MAKKPLILAVETSAPIGSAAIAIGEQILAEATFSGPMRHSSEILPAIGGLLQRFSRKPKDIEHIYISIGPGSFTGLRIAATLAKTMHLANATRVVAVDTLDVIAANTTDYTKEKNTEVETIATILDAKRGQFYVAVYQHCTSDLCLRYEQRLSAVASTLRSKATAEDGSAKAEATCALGTSNGIWKKILPDSLMTASQFLEKFAAPNKPVWLLGVGLVHYKDKFKANGIRFFDKSYWNPRAAKVHLLGWKMAQAGQFADPLTLTPLYLRRTEAEEKYHQRGNHTS